MPVTRLRRPQLHLIVEVAYPDKPDVWCAWFETTTTAYMPPCNGRRAWRMTDSKGRLVAFYIPALAACNPPGKQPTFVRVPTPTQRLPTETIG